MRYVRPPEFAPPQWPDSACAPQACTWGKPDDDDAPRDNGCQNAARSPSNTMTHHMRMLPGSARVVKPQAQTASVLAAVASHNGLPLLAYPSITLVSRIGCASYVSMTSCIGRSTHG